MRGRQGRRAATKAERQIVTGRLRITPAGFGLVKAPGDEVFVGQGALGPALDGDEVELQLTGRGERGPRGKVLRVTERPPRRLTGVVDDGGSFVADDPRALRPLRATGTPTPGSATTGSATTGSATTGSATAGSATAGSATAGSATAGSATAGSATAGAATAGLMLVGGELSAALGPDAAEVRLERCFGRRGDPRAEEDALLWREQLDEDFSAAALREADERARAVYEVRDPQRLDLRVLPFITIDPETAEDHDDALFAEREPGGGVRVYVAIADVGAFVVAGGPLDDEARRRSASLYLPGRVIPMLPSVLSSQAASLVPGRDRAALVLELSLDAEARVEDHRVVLGLIRSQAKLTYEDASAVLESGGAAGSQKARAHAETIELLDELAQRLRSQRRERGAIAVETKEVLIDTDERTGFPVRIARAAYDPWLSRAHQLVEEMMLLANETVAGALREQNAEVLFRIHDAPSSERAAALVEGARRHGVEIDASIALDPVALRGLIRAISDRSLRDELSALVLDAMPTALYASHRQDHFALASRHYVHFTSPIRRYADLTIHRTLRAAIANDGVAVAAVDPEVVNLGQQRARAIQREVAELYGALLMESRGGEVFQGTILRGLKRHWLVALDEPAVCVRCEREEDGLEEGLRVSVRIDAVSIAERVISASVVDRLPD